MHLLETNAISTVVINGLVSSSSGTELNAQFHRQTAPLDLCGPSLYGPEKGDQFCTPTVPPRQKSRLPAPRQLRLSATLGRYLGHGRSSVVCELDNVDVPGLESDVVIPQLVVKITRLDRAAWTAREGWYYDEIELLQGSVVPYCFGWFDMVLETGADGHPNCTIRVLEEHPVPVMEEKDLLPVFETSLHPLFEERSKRSDILSILVLERLNNDLLPLGKKIPEETEEDILGLHEELAYLGVLNVADFRRENILRAAPPIPGLPPRVTPFYKREHEFRLIDFELAIKANFTYEGARQMYGPKCVGALYDVEDAIVSDEDDDEEEEDSSSE